MFNETNLNSLRGFNIFSWVFTITINKTNTTTSALRLYTTVNNVIAIAKALT